jgi:uncharacterized membrane protein YphA (DoxX/SURF4 family)
MLKRIVDGAFWNSWGVLIARLIVAGQFLMATTFKFTGIGRTAGYIAAAGFPLSLPLAWTAAVFELLLVIAFLTGVYFRQAAFLAMLYVLFLGFAFHGPSHWAGNQMEFGSFVDHFIYAAALVYMVAHGTGNAWALRREQAG